MSRLGNLNPKSVFEFFEQLCRVPRGSGNTAGIRKYVMDFAEKRGLKAVCDRADNVIIFKEGTPGYRDSQPIIMQGHLDMVCEKEHGREIDFEKDPILPYVDGEWIKAEGTTLGADNGIAVAMMMAILDSDDIPHPPIEAVFTSDEEIGMVGAMQLDTSLLRGKKLINLDSEEEEVITVSCAGGSDFKMTLPVTGQTVSGSEVTLVLKGLQGGHSGGQIDKGRVNANLLAGRVLNNIRGNVGFDIVSVIGGEKGNAIPARCEIKLVSTQPEVLKECLESCLELVKKNISDREPIFSYEINIGSNGEHKALENPVAEKVINLLTCVPNGVQEMSVSIDNLVETSLNLGIFSAGISGVTAIFALRSNKEGELKFLGEKMLAFAKMMGMESETSGYYPPWEYREESTLRRLYREIYKEKIGTEPEIAAIHAGLECGVFAGKIADLDCISIGPEATDVHTPREKMNINSVKKVYEMVLELLKRSK